jgi:hypothetical protein
VVGGGDNSSVWCLAKIDRTQVEARIIHIGRGRFKAVEDKPGGAFINGSKLLRYKPGGAFINRVIDESDILHCRSE